MDPWLLILSVGIRGLTLLRHFSFHFSLGSDVVAGVSLAAMVIPQSVSYGTSLAKIGPTAGLVSNKAFICLLTLTILIRFFQFAASIPPIAYSLLGTSRQLNVAAEAALSLLVGQAITDYRHSYPNTPPDKLGIAVATAIGVQVRFLK